MAVLPKRIVDVGETNDEFVNLRDFGDKPTSAHYVCLSHRWQWSCPLITTQLNIESRKTRIAMDELSATLNDAILLTRAFNIRYLWIDSLCILQDSNLDWEIESSRMGAYYSRSWLTQAAGLDHAPIWPRMDSTKHHLSLARNTNQVIVLATIDFQYLNQKRHQRCTSTYKTNWSGITEALPISILEDGHCKKKFSPHDF